MHHAFHFHFQCVCVFSASSLESVIWWLDNWTNLPLPFIIWSSSCSSMKRCTFVFFEVCHNIQVCYCCVLDADERHLFWRISLASWCTLHHTHDSGWWNVWSGAAGIKDPPWLPWCTLSLLTASVCRKHTQHHGWTCSPCPLLAAGQKHCIPKYMYTSQTLSFCKWNEQKVTSSVDESVYPLCH